MSEETTAPTNVGGPGPRGGITLVVMSEDKLDAITEKARSLVDTIQRHDLDLIQAGLRPDEILREGDGCCNCVAC